MATLSRVTHGIKGYSSGLSNGHKNELMNPNPTEVTAHAEGMEVEGPNVCALVLARET